MNSGVTRTMVEPPVDIIECYASIMDIPPRSPLTRPNLPPPPPPPLPPPPLISFDRMPFCDDDQSSDLYETADPISWHIDV